MTRDWLLGVDIGGTFTDVVLLNVEDGRIRTHKLLSTPDEPGRAVREGVRQLAGTVEGVARVVHGTTLVTNALVERKGAVCALLTTQGFRDVLEIRREGRYDLYDLALTFPEPLVPRSRRHEVAQRCDETGRVLTPLDVEGVRTWARELPDDVASVAVCFLHGYANPEPEREAAAAIVEERPELSVSLSSEVAPEIREYERTSTVAANAYVRPLAERYLNRLESELVRDLGPGAALWIMQSDGGMIRPATAARFPVRIVESGPAGGAVAASRLCRGLQVSRAMSFDMGGTTAKIAFLEDARPRIHSSFEVDRRHFYRKGSGMPVLVPAVDLVEIGAGGGSLAGRGPLGTLEVGPQSAGADPGPACYGRGGDLATVTDADVVLGLLNPDYFLGGEMSLDVEAAREALARDVAGPFSLSLEDAAHGVFEVVNTRMAEAARVHAAERGIDLSDRTAVAFGGAGPVHAWSVARKLRIPRVLYPGHAGVESALGFLAAPPAFEAVRSHTARLEDLEEQDIRARFEELEAQAREVLDAEPSTVTRGLDMRYAGQGAEVRVTVEEDAIDGDALRRAFLEAYRNLYGRAVEGISVEIVTWRVRVALEAPSVSLFDDVRSLPAEVAAPTPHAHREAWLPDTGGLQRVPVYRRETLSEGCRFSGPAIVEETQSTLVLGRGTVEVLTGGTLAAHLEAL